MDCYPLAGILVSDKESKKAALNLYQYHNNLPLKLFAFSCKDVLWSKKRILGLCQSGQGLAEKTFPFPCVIYNRCYNKSPSVIDKFGEAAYSIKCFNRVNWISKWHVYELLSQSVIKKHVPDTFLLSKVNIAEITEKYRLVYIKPVYGARGNKVYRLEMIENGEINISMHSFAPRYICRRNEDIGKKLDEFLAGNDFIVQEGVRANQLKNHNYDIRVLVQKDIGGRWTITGMVSRIAHEQYFNTSIYEMVCSTEQILDRLFPAGKAKSAVIDAIYNISIEAARIVEKGTGLMGELSIDYMLDGDMNLWIIEINGKPQKSIYKDAMRFDYEYLAYSRPLEYAYYLATH